MGVSTKKSKVSEIVPLLYVDDIGATIAHYCEQLGFKRAMSWEPDGQLKWCRLERDAAAIMLQQVEGHQQDLQQSKRGVGICFYFNCDDVDTICQEFTTNGLKLPPVETTFYGMKQLELTDPDGYQICFQSTVESLSQ